MQELKLTNDETVGGVRAWFAQFGQTDTRYLETHYRRYLQTRTFALSEVPTGKHLRILDIGSHWLHNAFFYANQGHQLIVMDAPITLEIPAVREAARMMDAEIRPTIRMEKADGLVDMPADSVDMVLFCEVIEHLAFNPIPFWKQIYRVLKAQGRIIVTTPNAFYFRGLDSRLDRIMRGECFGLPVAQILATGTYGHHWKEFTLGELQEYFTMLSSDFDTTRYEMIYHPGEESIPVGRKIEELISPSVNLRAYNIYLNVVLKQKAQGIQVNPPWEPP